MAVINQHKNNVQLDVGKNSSISDVSLNSDIKNKANNNVEGELKAVSDLSISPSHKSSGVSAAESLRVKPKLNHPGMMKQIRPFEI